jgi:glutamine synthetase
MSNSAAPGTDVSDLFGSHCFSNAVMAKCLPKSIYSELLEVQAGQRELSTSVAEVVASAMRDWAIERGATHYTHWFHPLSGLTAEKHDAFVVPSGDGRVIMEFSGKELVKGEPDASSFPSGGLRATFEARGYTAWDVTSPAFLKSAPSGVTLCIPTAFVSYFGHALDKKVPLLRSMDALNRESLRVLRALGDAKTSKVVPTVGPEQEYFLVDRALYKKRPDLLLAGRTVFGSMPAKGQELEDHYYGAIEERVGSFMRELNAELWAMGVAAKTQHNEVAPAQFELACVYASANTAADANQLVMETIHKVAERHGMAALLHEKPFDGVNGSGKHVNWSLSTDSGANLLEPGKDPATNARFLLFLTAVVEAVDRNAGLLRASAATAGNDRRLGGHEAPPTVISIFLGEALSGILDSIVEGKPQGAAAATSGAASGGRLEIGVSTLPKLPRDLTDRNRTSPFAFTGNKFEFRMVASSQSVATPATILNAVVASVLASYADRLEAAAKAGKDLAAEVSRIVIESYREHRRVVFDGNGYSGEWAREADRRGLPKFKSAVDAIPEFAKSGAVALFEKTGVFTKEEIESRCLIYLERYAKQINIEAGVMAGMARRSIFPAASAVAAAFAREGSELAAAGAPSAAQELRAKRLAELAQSLAEGGERLEKALASAQDVEEPLAQAKAYRESVVPRMDELRAVGDELERLMDKAAWPFPSYEELLFGL